MACGLIWTKTDPVKLREFVERRGDSGSRALAQGMGKKPRVDDLA